MILPSHGTYPTYFREFSFTFNPLNTSGVYNTAETPGGIHAGSGLLYAAFTVDRSLLASPYQLHFDLYNTIFKRGDTDVNNFAPFSHDAGTTTRGVPEPSTALLLGVGLLGFGLWQRRRASLSA
ncbi:MAG: choice-of-anchor N protein [Nitrospira sp.]